MEKKIKSKPFYEVLINKLMRRKNRFINMHTHKSKAWWKISDNTIQFVALIKIFWNGICIFVRNIHHIIPASVCRISQHVSIYVLHMYAFCITNYTANTIKYPYIWRRNRKVERQKKKKNLASILWPELCFIWTWNRKKMSVHRSSCSAVNRCVCVYVPYEEASASHCFRVRFKFNVMSFSCIYIYSIYMRTEYTGIFMMRIIYWFLWFFTIVNVNRFHFI